MEKENVTGNRIERIVMLGFVGFQPWTVKSLMKMAEIFSLSFFWSRRAKYCNRFSVALLTKIIEVPYSVIFVICVCFCSIFFKNFFKSCPSEWVFEDLDVKRSVIGPNIYILNWRKNNSRPYIFQNPSLWSTRTFCSLSLLLLLVE